jgi:hypothetical protein
MTSSAQMAVRGIARQRRSARRRRPQARAGAAAARRRRRARGDARDPRRRRRRRGRLFAGDLFRMYQRYAEGMGWRVELISAPRGRVRAATRKSSLSVTGAGRVRQIEVRERRPPRPARARHRGGRAHPHLRRDGGGAARGRGSRYPDRRQGSAHRHLSLVGSGRAVGQHHRLRGAHRPFADRHWW